MATMSASVSRSTTLCISASLGPERLPTRERRQGRPGDADRCPEPGEHDTAFADAVDFGDHRRIVPVVHGSAIEHLRPGKRVDDLLQHGTRERLFGHRGKMAETLKPLAALATSAALLRDRSTLWRTLSAPENRLESACDQSATKAFCPRRLWL
jgi:hypothetical protein